MLCLRQRKVHQSISVIFRVLTFSQSSPHSPSHSKDLRRTVPGLHNSWTILEDCPRHPTNIQIPRRSAIPIQPCLPSPPSLYSRTNALSRVSSIQDQYLCPFDTADLRIVFEWGSCSGPQRAVNRAYHSLTLAMIIATTAKSALSRLHAWLRHPNCLR